MNQSEIDDNKPQECNQKKELKEDVKKLQEELEILREEKNRDFIEQEHRLWKSLWNVFSILSSKEKKNLYVAFFLFCAILFQVERWF